MRRRVIARLLVRALRERGEAAAVVAQPRHVVRGRRRGSGLRRRRREPRRRRAARRVGPRAAIGLRELRERVAQLRRIARRGRPRAGDDDRQARRAGRERELLRRRARRVEPAALVRAQPRPAVVDAQPGGPREALIERGDRGLRQAVGDLGELLAVHRDHVLGVLAGAQRFRDLGAEQLGRQHLRDLADARHGDHRRGPRRARTDDPLVALLRRRGELALVEQPVLEPLDPGALGQIAGGERHREVRLEVRVGERRERAAVRRARRRIGGRAALEQRDRGLERGLRLLHEHRVARDQREPRIAHAGASRGLRAAPAPHQRRPRQLAAHAVDHRDGAGLAPQQLAEPRLHADHARRAGLRPELAQVRAQVRDPRVDAAALVVRRDREERGGGLVGAMRAEQPDHQLGARDRARVVAGRGAVRDRVAERGRRVRLARVPPRVRLEQLRRLAVRADLREPPGVARERPRGERRARVLRAHEPERLDRGADAARLAVADAGVVEHLGRVAVRGVRVVHREVGIAARHERRAVLRGDRVALELLGGPARGRAGDGGGGVGAGGAGGGGHRERGHEGPGESHRPMTPRPSDRFHAIHDAMLSACRAPSRGSAVRFG